MQRATTALALAALALCPRVASAFDPFEIQVYDATANKRGAAGLELHLNRFATGRQGTEPPELPLHGQTHATFEPSYGVTDWWELGGYFQTTLREGGGFDYAGVKLRSKLVTPPDFHRYLRLGVNVELALLPEAYDRHRWGGEIRPMAAWEQAGWFLAVNPIVGLSFTGDGLSEGPSFEPAIKASRELLGVVAVGCEYYGGLGPIAHPAALADQEHLLFGVLDLAAFPAIEVNLGLGGGLTPASSGLVGKVILGVTWERLGK